MNVIESAPPPEGTDLKQRFQKRQEEKKENAELNLEALSDEDLVNVINRGRELWEKRRNAQIKELEERHAKLNALVTSGAPPAKRRGRKPKNASGD